MERKSAWSLLMSEQQIVNEYKEAKSPRNQIAILADQNMCDKKTIVNILEAAGCEVPGYYKKKTKDPEATAEVFDEIAEKTQKLQQEPVKEAPDSAKGQPLNEEQQANHKENKNSLSHEVLLAAAYIKAAAYDAIVQHPALWEDDEAKEFIAAVNGIRALVKKLIKEA